MSKTYQTNMEAEAGMDVAWCLTCSKSTRDPRRLYCSDFCRQADINPTPSSSSSKIPFTSPVPTALFSSPPIKALERRRSSASPTKASHHRPQLLSHATTVPPASEAAFPPGRSPMARDRRAFSFPSAPNSPPLVSPAVREKRGSTVLPPFARRAIMANLTPMSPTLDAVKEDHGKSENILAKRLNKSTGGQNTPGTAAESVFLSTSESSEDEADIPPKRPIASTLPSPATRVAPSTQFSTLRSQLTLGRTNSLQTRSTSGSPVAAMVASSASSRSREDIISWAKAINSRNEADDNEEDPVRGRPRTRRIGSLAGASQSTEPVPEDVEEDAEDSASAGYGTTPKGRIGSALAGLSGYVKALTSVTSPVRPSISRKTTPGRPGSSTLDFTKHPSPAEVSKVAVVASTMPLDEGAPVQYMGGGTPTLSTISFSEVVDPSVNGTHDHVEIATDDGGMSATSSGYARHSSIVHKMPRRSSFIPPPPVPERQRAPLRTTANAIWNLSTYISRFTPFSISSVIAPYVPPPDHSERPSFTSTQVSSVSPALTTPTPEAAAPMPAARSRPDTPDLSPAQQLVRSVPMDIVIPPCPVGEDEEEHRLHAHAHAERSRMRSSRSRARERSKRRSRDRDRSESAGRTLEYYDPYPLEGLGKGLGMTIQDPDADADVSGDEDVVRGGRGRGRRRNSRGAKTEQDTRGRGRDRSVKVI